MIILQFGIKANGPPRQSGRPVIKDLFSDRATIAGAATIMVVIVVTIMIVTVATSAFIITVIVIAITAIGAVAAVMITGNCRGGNETKHHENYKKADEKLHTHFS